MSPATISQSVLCTDAPLPAVDADFLIVPWFEGEGPGRDSRARPGDGRPDRPRARLQRVRRAPLRPVRHADRRPELEGRARRAGRRRRRRRTSILVWRASWRPSARWRPASGGWEVSRLRFARDWPTPPATSTSPASRRRSPKGSRSASSTPGATRPPIRPRVRRRAARSCCRTCPTRRLRVRRGSSRRSRAAACLASAAISRGSSRTSRETR